MDIAVTERLLRKAAGQKMPVNGSFELTADCNFNCRMCYIHNCGKKAQSDADRPYEDWKKVFDEATDMMLFYALLTGGEPLMHRDFEKIYRDLYSRGMLISVNTNGYLIDKAVIELFRKYPPAGVNVSLYGTTDGIYGDLCGVRDGFSVVSKNIESLKDAGINMKINMTVTKTNRGDIDNILAFAKEHSVSVRPTTYIFDSGDSCRGERLQPEEAARTALYIFRKTHSEKAFRDEMQRVKMMYNAGKERKGPSDLPGVSCLAGKSSYWVHYDGKLSFCGIKQTENAVSVFDSGFRNAWNYASTKAEKCRMPEKCCECYYRYVCNKCYSMFETDGIPMADAADTYTCRYYRTYTEECIKNGY